MAEEGLNEVRLIGRLTADPELRFTQSNQGVLSFRLAATKTWLDTNAKERKEKTEFVNCIVWGKRGEGLNKVLSRGSRVWVGGELQTRSWDDRKTGDKRYATEVVVGHVVLLGGGKGAAVGGSGDYNNSTDTPDGSVDDDQIPF